VNEWVDDLEDLDEDLTLRILAIFFLSFSVVVSDDEVANEQIYEKISRSA
jgi:hypothetical protein